MTTVEINFGNKTEKKSSKVTDRIKTFEDACRELQINPGEKLILQNQVSVLANDLKSILAYAKLIIIARALNEGWVPDWSDSNQYKYYPWLEYKSGVGFSYGDFVNAYTYSSVGSRLCFPTWEMAKYFGQQFIDIHQIVLTK